MLLGTGNRLGGSFCTVNTVLQITLFTFTVVLVFPRLAQRVNVKDRGNFGSCCYLSLSNKAELTMNKVINSILATR